MAHFSWTIIMKTYPHLSRFIRLKCKSHDLITVTVLLHEEQKISNVYRVPSIIQRLGQKLYTSTKSGIQTRRCLVFSEPDNDVRRPLRLAGEVVFENILRSLRIPRLCIKRGTRVVRRHGVSTSQTVLHRPPYVIFRRRLDVPYISPVTCEIR